jgi:glycosyltransferase involved in cell wall biosynthesis
MLTIYIPTFNRGRRLFENLKLVMDEIQNFGLQDKVSILVGDNASEDETQSVCEIVNRIAKDRNIEFNYFRNQSNLGFNGNIQAGYLKVTSGWIMFLSDDDVLFTGALNQICSDITSVQPDVSLYNFDQFPFGRQNPLVPECTVHEDGKDFSHLASLFSWQKLTGVVLRCRKLEDSNDFFRDLLSPATHFPHVILAVLCYYRGNILYKSDFFVAGHDPDYLDHVNFLWYTQASFIKELENCKSVLGIDNASFDEQVSKIPRVNVIDSSVTHLVYYYAGKARISRSVKRILWSNVFRFMTLRRTSQEGFILKSHSPKFYVKLFSLALIYPASYIILPTMGIKRKLMHEGF